MVGCEWLNCKVQSLIEPELDCARDESIRRSTFLVQAETVGVDEQWQLAMQRGKRKKDVKDCR